MRRLPEKRGSRYQFDVPVLDFALTKGGVDLLHGSTFTHQNAAPTYAADGIDFSGANLYERIADPLNVEYSHATAKLIRNTAVACVYRLAVNATAKGHIVSVGNRNVGISISIGGSAALNTAGRRLWVNQEGQSDVNTAVDLPNDGLPHSLVLLADIASATIAKVYFWLDGVLVYAAAAQRVVELSGTVYFSLGTLQAASDSPATGDSTYQLNGGSVRSARLYQDASLRVGRNFHADTIS